MQLYIPCLFGLESLVSEELQELGADKKDLIVQDGAVILATTPSSWREAVARANVFLRTGERVLLSLSEFPARTFDELFDGVSEINWEELIPRDFVLAVNGFARKSALTSLPACQGIIKKAIVRRLLSAKGLPSTAKLVEDPGAGTLRIQFAIVSDRARIMIDTSGESLHKRGYRPLATEAPIRETLAAGLVRLTQYRPFGSEAFVDPFCGSGTLVNEAAMRAFHVAPGLRRPFAGESWPILGKPFFEKARAEAYSLQKPISSEPVTFFGSDIDPKLIPVAERNARAAGVYEGVSFEAADAFTRTPEVLNTLTDKPRQLILTNPPYGERLLDAEKAEELYRGIAGLYLDSDGFCRAGMRLAVISPDDTFERFAGRPADKRRKLYNGNIRCQLYQYFKLPKH